MKLKKLYSKHVGLKGKYFSISFFNPLKKLFSFTSSTIPEINEKSIEIYFLFFKFYYVIKTDLPF